MMGAALSACFAIITCFVSNNLGARFEHRQETIQMQLAILEGRPYVLDGSLVYFGGFQNRVLFPLVLKGTSSWGEAVGVGSIGQWFLALELITAFAAFVVVWQLLRKHAGASPKLAAVGLGLLTYELIFTFNQGWEHPTDFPDVAFTALMLWAAIARQRAALFVIAVLAALNRESAVFGGFLWCVLHAFDSRLRLQPIELAFGALVSLSAFICALGVRLYLGGVAALAQGNFDDFAHSMARLTNDLAAVLHPNPSSWPVLLAAMIAVPGIWIWWNRARIRERDKRLLVSAAVIFIISVVFGQLPELRDFITSIVLVVFVAAASEGWATRFSTLTAARAA